MYAHEPAFPVSTLDDCVADHMEIPGSVAIATSNNRAARQAYVANELGVPFSQIRCRTRYGRMYTRQEIWDMQGAGDWEYDHNEPAEPHPPEDWQVPDYYPVWELCHKNMSGATKIFLYTLKIATSTVVTVHQ